MAGAAALVMPDFIPGVVDGVAELDGIEQGPGGLIQGEAGLSKLLVVQANQAVVLLIERIDEGFV